MMLTDDQIADLKEAIEIAQANIFSVYDPDRMHDFFQMDEDARRAMGEVETIADILGIKVEHYDYSPQEGQLP